MMLVRLDAVVTKTLKELTTINVSSKIETPKIDIQLSSDKSYITVKLVLPKSLVEKIREHGKALRPIVVDYLNHVYSNTVFSCDKAETTESFCQEVNKVFKLESTHWLDDRIKYTKPNDSRAPELKIVDIDSQPVAHLEYIRVDLDGEEAFPSGTKDLRPVESKPDRSGWKQRCFHLPSLLTDPRQLEDEVASLDETDDEVVLWKTEYLEADNDVGTYDDLKVEIDHHVETACYTYKKYPDGKTISEITIPLKLSDLDISYHWLGCWNIQKYLYYICYINKDSFCKADDKEHFSILLNEALLKDAKNGFKKFRDALYRVYPEGWLNEPIFKDKLTLAESKLLL